MTEIRQDWRVIEPNLVEIEQDRDLSVVLSFNGLYIDRNNQLMRDSSINWFVEGNASIVITGDSCEVSFKGDDGNLTGVSTVFCVSRLDGKIFKKSVIFVKRGDGQ